MKVQFDVPKRPANKAEIIWFDIKKEVLKALEPCLVGYMKFYQKTKTGSEENFKEATMEGLIVLGVVVLLAIVIIYKCTCLLCCSKKEKKTADSDEKQLKTD